MSDEETRPCRHNWIGMCILCWDEMRAQNSALRDGVERLKASIPGIIGSVQFGTATQQSGTVAALSAQVEALKMDLAHQEAWNQNGSRALEAAESALAKSCAEDRSDNKGCPLLAAAESESTRLKATVELQNKLLKEWEENPDHGRAVAELTRLREREKALTDDDVEWVVNDIAELGVKIRDQFFFLYKGRSYQGGAMWRLVFKREFGEVCHPWETIYYHEKKHESDFVTRDNVRLPDRYIGYLGEDESDWKILPAHKTDPCEYEEPCPACARLAALSAEPEGKERR